MLPHYVYVLMDPDSKNVFYVGKGMGQRMYSHKTEVEKIVNLTSFSQDDGSLSQDDLTHKQKKLREILANGKEPIELVVGRYETEIEAFSVEATLIGWVYGFDDLTNLNHGHGGKLIRPKDIHQEIPGIDIPKTVRSFDGEFKNGKIQGLTESGAYDYFEMLKGALSDNNYMFRDFSSKEDRPYDCGESNGWLGVLVNINGIDLIIQFSKSQKVNILIATTKSTRESLSMHEDSLRKADFYFGASKNTKVAGIGRYIDFDPKIKFSPDAISDVIEKLNAILECTSA